MTSADQPAKAIRVAAILAAMTRIASGPWDLDTMAYFLNDSVIPVRLATNGSSGPLVQSLWFAPDGLDLWCCTQRTSLLAKRLGRDSRVGFEVARDEPPYRGVRGTGDATLHTENVEETLRTLIRRYQGEERTQLSDWLLSRTESEVAIHVRAQTVSSWDYSPRMTN